MSKITPRILKGFRDYLPELAIARQEMIRTLEKVFVSYGYSPIDTPALEYSEILLGKGSEESDKQLFRFKDNGDRDVSLRFDLTVPLARYVAMHSSELTLPFRRYHIAPVWRAEKPQRGRFREFMQCDFDIIGCTSASADAEIIAVINSALKSLKIDHHIRINNRQLLNALLEDLGLADKSTQVLRAIDKLEKLGKKVVSDELEKEAGADSQTQEKIFTFLSISESSNVIKELASFFNSSDKGTKALQSLKEVITLLESHSIPAENFSIDLSIARGLDYYTGLVFETTCTELPEIGSICSGGRYDNLTGIYSRQNHPGVGASIGLDRALAALEELGKIDKKQTPAKVIVTTIAENPAASLEIAKILREEDINTEVFPEAKKLAQQLKYANNKGLAYAIIIDKDDHSICSLKNLDSGEQLDKLKFSEVTKHIK